MKTGNFVLAGEAMALFIAQEEAPLEEVVHWESAVAGAELNVAIGLARLGHSVSYLTALGDDSFGRMIRAFLKKNGIGGELAFTDSKRQTGFMLKGKVSRGDPPIQYFRKGSAASALGETETASCLDGKEGGFLHMTGIFPALSEQTLAASEDLMRRAREKGMTVTFDPNLRPQLWPDEETMTRTLNRLAGYADVFLPGVKEGKLLCGEDTPEGIASYYLDRGVKAVVVKTGAQGAYGATREERFQEPTFRAETIVDTVGAGDGFAAGVLSAMAEGLPLREWVRRGNAIGTLQIMSVGDNTGLPDREQLQHFMDTTPQEEST